MDLPVIDIAPLFRAAGPGADRTAVAVEIDRAARAAGFFYVAGHGVDPELLARLDREARAFFALPEQEKARVAMTGGGHAWRGWFPLGGELTSGVPDHKEGYYFGTEDDPDDPRPLHGANRFPARPAGLAPAVMAYMAEMERVGQAVLSAMAEGLGLVSNWFADHLTATPLQLFRIFRYPPLPSPAEADGARWGVGEHTDYGLLTLLAQDEHGGLAVRTPDGWVDAPPVPGTFVCNLGDMLERLTGGQYRSTPHRVLHTAAAGDRLSFPYFLDPSWDSVVERLPIVPRPADDDGAADRWDRASVHGFTGTYGDYITAKVGKVFPALGPRRAT